MSSWNSVASHLLACVMAVDLLVVAPATNGASAEQSAAHRASARSYVLESRRRGRVRIALPRGASQIYNDYPYYYARGYYPRHIGGYVYYPSLYSGRRYSARTVRCADWYRRCVAGQGGQRGACRCP
jgi:hypothetical protein